MNLNDNLIKLLAKMNHFSMQSEIRYLKENEERQKKEIEYLRS